LTYFRKTKFVKKNTIQEGVNCY